jgi:uncharacterized membrane protein
MSNTITSTSSAFAAFVIGRLRYARIQAEIVLNQIDSASAALSAGWIGGEDALACLDESGLLDFVTGISS